MYIHKLVPRTFPKEIERLKGRSYENGAYEYSNNDSGYLMNNSPQKFYMLFAVVVVI